jgi:ABC-type branched-subunit amino acid transport system substrate-binding protein
MSEVAPVSLPNAREVAASPALNRTDADPATSPANTVEPAATSGGGLAKLRPWTRASWRLLSKWIVFPLLGTLVGAIVVGRIAATILGPATYKVYVVGNFQSNNLPQRILDRLLKDPVLGEINGVQIKLERQYAAGDPAAAQQQAEVVAARPDTLMVVGHFSSTATKAALPAYLRAARPKIPVIMTTETNPNLMPPRAGDSYDPVFRLSPTDDEQAIVAAGFAMNKKARAFLVVEDQTNPVYSQFLTKTFCHEILTTSRGRPTPVILRAHDVTTLPIEAMRAMGVDWVFFAGSAQNAVLLARQVKAMQGGRPIQLLFSDASVDQQLAEGGPAVEGAYVTYSTGADTYNSDQGSGEYGTNAFMLMQQLVENANDHFAQRAGEMAGVGYQIRRILGLKSVSDARSVLIATMEHAIDNKWTFRLNDRTESKFSSRDVEAVGDAIGGGMRERASFHVWQICKQKFVEASCSNQAGS